MLRSHYQDFPLVRGAAVLVVGGLLGVLVWVNRAELPAVGRALVTARISWLLVGTLVLVLWWAAWLLLYLACRRLAGVGGYGEAARLAPVAVGAVALNLVVKSGGLAGLVLFALDGRRRGMPTGRVAGAYVLAASLADLALVVTLGAAVAVVWVDGRLTAGELVALAVFVVFVAVRLAVVLGAVRDRELLRWLWTLPARSWDRLRRRSTRRYDTANADELFDAVAPIRSRPGTALPALGYAVCIDVLGAAMLWAAVAAVGGGSRPVLALVTYAMSALLGIVGMLPGGLGFVEIGAVAMLASFGVPVGLAAAAVLLFRVWDYWLPVAVGGTAAWWLRRRVVEAVP
jgi:uncharacterized membrane protein YbhN (UPF0104 family)